MDEPTKIEDYAIRLLAEGGEATAEDDLDEGGAFEVSEEQDWRDACDLSIKMAQAVGKNRASFLAWHRSLP